MIGVRRLGPAARSTRPWRVRLLAAALALPGPAYAYSLDELLRMPLEHLVQLQITQQRGEQAAAPEHREGGRTTGEGAP